MRAGGGWRRRRGHPAHEPTGGRMAREMRAALAGPVARAARTLARLAGHQAAERCRQQHGSRQAAEAATESHTASAAFDPLRSSSTSRGALAALSSRVGLQRLIGAVHVETR